MMRALLARVVVFAVTSAMLPALAGCGRSSSSGSASGGLRAALAAVKAGPPSRQYFEWGDTKRLRQLAHLRPDGTPSSRSSANDRFAVVSGTGLGALAPIAPTLTPVTGLQLFAADRAISIGTPPRSGTRLDGSGVGGGALPGKLRAKGSREASVAGHKLLAIGAEGSLQATDAFGVGLLNHFDRVIVNDDTVVTGGYLEPVLELAGGSPSLGVDPARSAAASCLGNVSWAVLLATTPPAAVNGIPGGAELVALGGRTPNATKAEDVVCIVYGAPAAASAEEARIRHRLVPPVVPPHALTPLGAVYSAPVIDTTSANGRSSARATLEVRPQKRPGFLVEVYDHGDLGPLLGASSSPGP